MKIVWISNPTVPPLKSVTHFYVTILLEFALAAFYVLPVRRQKPTPVLNNKDLHLRYSPRTKQHCPLQEKHN